MSASDRVYVLATDEAQATMIFFTYQTVDDEAAIQMIRSGMVSAHEDTAREHQKRAGTGKLFSVSYSITECS